VEDGDFWAYGPENYKDLLVMPERSFIDHIAPRIPDEVNLLAWYFVMDGSRIQPRDAGRLVAALRGVERQMATLLPDAQTFITPTDALQLYGEDVRRLNQILLVFNLPTIGLVLAFIGLVGILLADQRRNELAVMRSRGAPVTQLVAAIILEALLTGLIAFGLAILLSMGLTWLMGKARSFLDFSATTSVRVIVGPTALRTGLMAAFLAILAQLLPTFSTIQYTVVNYKLIRARGGQAPWWQRSYLDLLLAGVAAYGYYVLQAQGGLFAVAGNDGGDPFQNPLLFLLPAFIIFAVTLLALRVLPWLMQGAAWLLQLTNSVATLQAARYLARSPRMYTTPLIMLVLTVSFAIYTASLAQTLDFQLYDQQFYRTGGDVNLYTPPAAGTPNAFGMSASSNPEDFLYLPMSRYEEIEGVRSAARVANYSATGRIGSQDLNGRFYGIDWHDFPDTVYWRWDFSSYRLGSLMNALGNHPDGVLVPESVLPQYGVRAGDPIRMTVRVAGASIEYEARIVGTFRAFPTWYAEEDGFLFVGDLDSFFREAGNQFPYRVWLQLDDDITDQELRLRLDKIGLLNSEWFRPDRAIETGLTRPERQGLFGLLSIGFIAATSLTILGLFLYALFSYRQRVVELGILRAVGLSTGRMTGLIAWELALLVSVGLLLGSSLGIGVSRLFIPYLQVGESSVEQVPEFLVEISWAAVSQVYLLYGLLFILALSALVLLATRMRVFMAIKLGETV
ncbi:MAG: FtsX-like permease family protein, partial [Anaerolineales bacterium]|nr:FtsX-like permease family protein [Anaerolineales bacterium]